MTAVYIFSLVLGGSFLLVSVLGDLFGGAADIDVDADLDLSGAGDAADALEAAEFADATNAADASDLADGTAATKIFSIRGLIYALFGFGAVGSALTWLGEAGFVETFVAAVVGGVLSGGVVTLVFNWLRSTEALPGQGDHGFVGRQATVTLPLSAEGAGQVVVNRGGRRITLRAAPWEGGEGDPREWRTVLIMEMEGGVARVAPVEEDLTLGP